MTQNLIDLIGSRICHDLISPIGAIGNGVELLTMGNETNGPEIDLIAESVDNANARIRFFRIAYGTSAATQSTGSAEISAILKDHTHGGKIVIEWQPNGDFPRPNVKLVFLLIQCFETAMPWGGKITISQIGNQWAIYGQAQKMNIDASLWGRLTSSEPNNDISAAQVQFALAPLAAKAIGQQLNIENSENSIRIRF